jgi:hypothetical protein
VVLPSPKGEKNGSEMGFCADFFWAWWIGVFAGVLAKMGVKTRCFGGEFVVVCVVKMVVEQP